MSVINYWGQYRQTDNQFGLTQFSDLIRKPQAPCAFNPRSLVHTLSICQTVFSGNKTNYILNSSPYCCALCHHNDVRVIIIKLVQMFFNIVLYLSKSLAVIYWFFLVDILSTKISFLMKLSNEQFYENLSFIFYKI